MDKQLSTLDWNDTFLDWDHLKQSFPGHEVKMADGENEAKGSPPYM